jgi:hypothetical protein
MITKFKDYKQNVVKVDAKDIVTIKFLDNGIDVYFNNGKVEKIRKIDENAINFSKEQYQHVHQYFKEIASIL